MNIKLKSVHDMKKMRKANRIVGDILEMMHDLVRPGVSTYELNSKALDYIRKNGGKPAFLGVRVAHDIPPFPGVLCTSINEEVVHGIPSRDRKLHEGDIISIDVGVLKAGFYGDAACTYAVGEIDSEKRRLMDTTKESLKAGLKNFEYGKQLGDIGYAVQSVAEAEGYGIVKDFVGHGIGRGLWEEPQVPNYGEAGTGIELVPGMALAIEPMVNMGTGEVKIESDGWTVVTLDKKPSAHFEHSSVLTDNGLEILTMYPSW